MGGKMNVYRRYFKIETGPVIEAVKEIEQINNVAHEEYTKILKKIGAEDGYYHRGRRLVSIIFKDAPDSALYRKNDSGWYPKKNCKEGKALAKRIESIKTKSPKEALHVLGLSSTPSLFGGGRAYYNTTTVIPDTPPIAYISVPWYDEDPEVMRQYQKDKAAGKHMCVNYDSILWRPTADMVEVKKWEVDRAIDEWNEKVKAENSESI